VITFTELGNLGRLGNQLFQYAVLRGVAIKTGQELKIPNPAKIMWHGQNSMLAQFRLECEYLEKKDYASIKYQYREADHMIFHPNVFEVPPNTDLYGFFQSTKYFEHCLPQIIKELQPNQEETDIAKERMELIRKENPSHKIISMHLRRGDNTDGSNPSKSLNEMYGRDNTFERDSFYGEFLGQAKQLFYGTPVKYLIFTGGSRQEGNSNTLDIEWCKRNFKGQEYIYSENNGSFEDFCLIKEADHNIISPVSSFGWWAAFLNQTPGKTVIAPEIYDPSNQKIKHREGFYPSEWILL
jgi:hypothetical protein